MIKLDEARLKGLLESRRKYIEKASIPFDGIFASITFLFSLLISSEDPEVNLIVLAVFWVLFIVYSGWVLVRTIRGIAKKYTIINLYQDIANIDERKHEFVLIPIRCTEGAYQNCFLLKYDVRWKCYLLPYCKIVPNTDEPIEKQVARYLCSSLGLDIDAEKIQHFFDAEHTKYSVSDKVDKTYFHHFYGIEIPGYEGSKKRKFKKGGSKYCWYTISQMDENKQMKKKNAETISDLRDYFNI